jgi:hypothetical protein
MSEIATNQPYDDHCELLFVVAMVEARIRITWNEAKFLKKGVKMSVTDAGCLRRKHRSYPLGSNERISNRGGTNSRSVSPGLNKSYSRQTKEEYSQAGVDRQESHGTSDYRERDRNKRNYTTNQETGRPNQINDKDDRTCYFCRNKGHIKRACRKFQNTGKEL